MNLKSVLESLLFVSDHPLSITEIAKLTEEPKEILEEKILELLKEYKESNRGIQIIKNQDRYQMVSLSDNAEVTQKFLKNETTGELTRPQLETLTTIAYCGPITKPELEQIRGVNCSLVLRNLMMRDLVELAGNKDGLDQFIVSLNFLKFLGVNEINELPEYERLHNHSSIQEML